MRISTLGGVFLVLVAITACNASASEQPVGYSQAADAFLPQTESPVLFVGQNRGSGFGTGGLQGDLLPEHHLFGEHRAVRVCSAQPSEGDISGMYEVRRAAFVPRAMCWCWPCSIGRISAAAGN